MIRSLSKTLKNYNLIRKPTSRSTDLPRYTFTMTSHYHSQIEHAGQHHYIQGRVSNPGQIECEYPLFDTKSFDASFPISILRKVDNLIATIDAAISQRLS